MENAKKYYKEFKILRAQIENQGKKKINVKRGQPKVVANSVHNKTSSSHPPQSHPKALKSLTADSASLNEADIDNVELTEDDMVDPDLLQELKMMGYKETKPVNDDKKSLEDTMNEYKSKALQAKKLAIWRMQKSIIKSLKFSRAQIENQGKKRLMLSRGSQKSSQIVYIIRRLPRIHHSRIQRH